MSQDTLTTEQLGQLLLEQSKKMTPEETAETRKILDEAFHKEHRPMTITRANIIKYWASGPDWTPVPESYFDLNFSQPCVPDLATLTANEKDLHRPAIETHPEYLLGAIPHVAKAARQ